MTPDMNEMQHARDALRFWVERVGRIAGLKDAHQKSDSDEITAFAVTTDRGERYILKNITAKLNAKRVETEYDLLQHLQAFDVPVAVPIPSDNGQLGVEDQDRIYLLYPMLPVDRAPPTDIGRAYANIALPGLHLSGSLDETRLGVTKADQRRIPYDRIRLADQYLLFFDGADHRSFLGHPAGPGRPERDPRFQELIKLSTTAFLDAYLKKDPTALAWLQGTGMKKALGADGAWELKTPGRVK